MPIVIPVRMHYSMQDLWFDPKSTGAKKGDHVVVATERGTELGLACGDPFVASAKEVHGELKPVLRVADESDLSKAEALVRKGEEAMPVFRRLVKENGLDMKPVGVEFLFGGEKAVFYFAAEERVDFRELVRELASHFHQRVDMRQIGVRDEARLVGGYAPCGQELCCVRFGGEFEPVSIRMAKEQDLPLNSAKISGVCGRLMCCLRYEFEAYRDFKQRAPKKNALINTPLGKAKIVEYNTPRETLTLRLENGKSFTVALADMTCSEGCRKRAAEQHAPLRPDTVTREALEALGTAEIALQLAELDRTNSPDGGCTLDDSLLSSRERRHRSGSRAGGAGTGAQAGGKRRGQDSSDGGRTPRRTNKAADRTEGANTDGGEGAGPGRRQHKGVESEAKAQEQRRPRGGGMRPRRTNKAGGGPKPAPEERAGTRGPDGGEGSPTRRTRRHHTVPTAAQADAGGTERREQAPRRRPAERREQTRGTDGDAGGQAGVGGQRRRHHAAGSGDAGRTADGRAGENRGGREGAGGTAQGGQRPTTRRRRPGDRGGSGGAKPPADV